MYGHGTPTNDESRYLSIAPGDLTPLLHRTYPQVSPRGTPEVPPTPAAADGDLNKSLAIRDLLASNQLLHQEIRALRHEHNASQTRVAMQAMNMHNDFHPTATNSSCYACADKDAMLQDFTAKLGKSEYEEDQLQRNLAQLMQEYETHKTAAKANLQQLENELTDVSTRNTRLETRVKQLEGERENTKAYMATLPKKDEMATLQAQVEQLTHLKTGLKEKVIDLNQKRSQLKAVEKANQKTISDKVKEINDLKYKLATSEKNLKTLECFLKQESADENTELPHDAIARLEMEVNELTVELSKYKRLTKDQRTSIASERANREKLVKSYSAEREQMMDRIANLEDEQRCLQIDAKTCRLAMEETSQEKCLVEQERDSAIKRLQKMQDMKVSEKYHVNERVADTLQFCISQMNNFTKIMRKLRHDHELDYSMLLETPSPTKWREQDSENLDACVCLQNQVESLKRDVIALRSELSDAAANDIGSDCALQ